MAIFTKKYYRYYKNHFFYPKSYEKFDLKSFARSGGPISVAHIIMVCYLSRNSLHYIYLTTTRSDRASELCKNFFPITLISAPTAWFGIQQQKYVRSLHIYLVYPITDFSQWYPPFFGVPCKVRHAVNARFMSGVEHHSSAFTSNKSIRYNRWTDALLLS